MSWFPKRLYLVQPSSSQPAFANHTAEMSDNFFPRMNYSQSIRSPLKEVHKLIRDDPVYANICGKNQIQNKERTWHYQGRVMLQNRRQTLSNQYLVNKESCGNLTQT